MLNNINLANMAAYINEATDIIAKEDYFTYPGYMDFLKDIDEGEKKVEGEKDGLLAECVTGAIAKARLDGLATDEDVFRLCIAAGGLFSKVAKYGDAGSREKLASMYHELDRLITSGAAGGVRRFAVKNYNGKVRVATTPYKEIAEKTASETGANAGWLQAILANLEEAGCFFMEMYLEAGVHGRYPEGITCQQVKAYFNAMQMRTRQFRMGCADEKSAKRVMKMFKEMYCAD